MRKILRKGVKKIFSSMTVSLKRNIEFFPDDTIWSNTYSTSVTNVSLSLSKDLVTSDQYYFKIEYNWFFYICNFTD